MSEKTFQELKELQDSHLKKLETSSPELFERDENPVESDLHDAMAISSLAGDRIKGYVGYFPHDTIIDELDTRGRAASGIKVDTKRKGDVTKCLLIKGALSHYEAQQNIAHALDIPLEDVSYAEAKDTYSLSYSSITIRNVHPEKVEKLDIPGVILKNCAQESRSIDPGSLSGNVYTMLVRTENPVEEKWLKERVSELHVDGCINYFDIKKFGGLRLLMHKLGAYVVRGEYQRAVEEVLFNSSPYDIDLIKNMRKEAKELDPDIDRMISLYETLPIIFRIELDFLRYLKENPEDYIGALMANQKYVKGWIFSYQAYLFNSYISGLRKQGMKFPSSVPLMFSGGKDAIQLYDPWLKKHSTDEFWRFSKDFLKTILRSKKTRTTKLYPDFYQAVTVPQGVLLSFMLPKNANPHVVLMNMFELHDGDPVPEWVQVEEIDVGATMKKDSVKEIKKQLGEHLDRTE